MKLKPDYRLHLQLFANADRWRWTEREKKEKALFGGWLMGSMVSVLAGKHVCPDGEVKVWQRSAERSLLVVLYQAAAT